MITEQDLNAAIAECQGERDPNANTCIKLAAFYTIKNELYGKNSEPVVRGMPQYSTAPPPVEPARRVDTKTTVDFQSDSEFGQMIRERNISEVLALIDELMEALQVRDPRLYDCFMDRLEK